MALPRERDTYAHYTDQLVYFSARLAADPAVSVLGPKIDELLAQLDADAEILRAARRAEIHGRAQRDHRDGLGDDELRRLRRRIDGFKDADFLRERLFPKGIRHTVTPRGRPQLQRIDQVLEGIDDLLASPRLAAHPEAEDIGALLGESKDRIADTREALRQAVELWEAQTVELAQARDAFNFRRSEGVDRLGAVIGELRALLGGKRDAAYAFTAPSRRSSSGEDEGEDEGEAA